MSAARLILIVSLTASFVHAAEPAAKPDGKPATAAGVCGDQAKVPADKHMSNTVRWATASEENTFGYDVYRAEKEDGPFARLTKKPILGAVNSDETHKYQYVDEMADPCIDHWYYVEEITTSGARSKFTPVFRRPPRLLPDGTPAPPKPAEAVSPPEKH